MPVVGLGFHVVIALFFSIHAIRTRQETYWLYILFAFPFLASVVYGITIWLPEARSSQHGYHLERKLKNVIDPQRELREAKNDFELSPTIDTHLRLANAFLVTGYASQSLEHYRNALVGIYANAPDILLNYAKALYESGDPLEAKNTLDKLREFNPTYESDEGHLLYAQALSGLNLVTEARTEFEALVEYHPSLEVYLCYAERLIDWGNISHAQYQLNQAQQRIKRLPKHARRLNGHWISKINKLSSQIKNA